MASSFYFVHGHDHEQRPWPWREDQRSAEDPDRVAGVIQMLDKLSSVETQRRLPAPCRRRPAGFHSGEQRAADRVRHALAARRRRRQMAVPGRPPRLPWKCANQLRQNPDLRGEQGSTLDGAWSESSLFWVWSHCSSTELELAFLEAFFIAAPRRGLVMLDLQFVALVPGADTRCQTLGVRLFHTLCWLVLAGDFVPA